MKFLDLTKVYIRSGSGGNGATSFRREKYVEFGGPDGGDGGKGGDVIMFATDNVSTLSNFRFKRKFFADNGENGGNRKMFGRGGKDLRLPVPVGTIIREIETGRIIA
ncbi:MAG TPA: GTPase ObgE, partial [Paracoccaceae bacterium]|nr:GTPase ObgE [Paracoccaceae bacterium]